MNRRRGAPPRELTEGLAALEQQRAAMADATVDVLGKFAIAAGPRRAKKEDLSLRLA